MFLEKSLLVVDSEPRNKKVYLDGKYLNKTPFQYWSQYKDNRYYVEVEGGESYIDSSKYIIYNTIHLYCFLTHKSCVCLVSLSISIIL